MQLTSFNELDICILLDYLEDHQCGHPRFWEMFKSQLVFAKPYHKHLNSILKQRLTRFRPNLSSFRKKYTSLGFGGNENVIFRLANRKQSPCYVFDAEEERTETLIGVHLNNINIRICVEESTLDRIIPTNYFLQMVARYPLFDEFKYSMIDEASSLSLWEKGKRMCKMVCKLD